MSNKFETKWIKRRAGKLCLVILLSAILLLSGCGEAGTDVMTLKRIPYAGDIVNEVPELVNSTEGLEIFEFTLDEGISGYSVDRHDGAGDGLDRNTADRNRVQSVYRKRIWCFQSRF